MLPFLKVVWFALVVSAKFGVVLIRAFPSVCSLICHNCVSVVSEPSSSQLFSHLASFASRPFTSMNK